MMPLKRITSALIFTLGIAWVVPSYAQGTANTSSAMTPPGASSSVIAPAIAGAPSATTAAATAPRNVAATLAVVDPGATVVSPDHSQHVPKQGDKIYEGDAIVTNSGEVHLDMADGGYVAVRPNTTMRIAKYQANGDADDHSVIGLIKGSLRSITGWIGHDNPKNYAIVTPTATIGVRGTDHEPAYVPEGTPGQDAGTYDNVHAGGTTIATASGKVDVTPDHAGFVDFHPNSKPRVLEHVPSFFQAPHAHDNLLVGKHEKVMAGLTQRRTERIEQHRQELRGEPAARAGNANHAGGALAQRPGGVGERSSGAAAQRPGGLAERAGERPSERAMNPGANSLAGRQEAAQARPHPLLDAMQHARENAAANAASRGAAVQGRPAAAPAAMPARPQLVRPAPAAKEPPKRKD